MENTINESESRGPQEGERAHAHRTFTVHEWHHNTKDHQSYLNV